MTAYKVLDVFTKTAFGGNPLAVIPDASGLAESDLQRIAREFNFSETTFVFPPKDPQHRARVRIFTPVNEIPFAGHPTIGTAIAIAKGDAEQEMILELGIGPITAKVQPGKPNRASFTLNAPLERLEEVTPITAAECISLPADCIKTDCHTPLIASVGLPFCLVELNSLEALEKAAPDMAANQRAEIAHTNDVDLFAVFCYVRNGDQIDARMFAPLINVHEDPATGSASAALGALLADLDDAPVDLSIRQGYAMGRPSQISVSAKQDGQCTQITVSGAAVQVMEGKLTL